MPRLTAAIRTHGLRQIAATRIVRRPRGCFGLDADNPVLPGIERKLRVQAIDQCRPVLVEERDETDRPLLRVTLREGERPRASVLTAKRFVPSFRRLNHLVVERREV